jgi:hypothetical protein
MHEWVKVQLKEYSNANAEERQAWWITIKWYFGFCAKKGLGEPSNRENGKVFGEKQFYQLDQMIGKRSNGAIR